MNLVMISNILDGERKSKQITDGITELENQSFEGWSDDAINGYLTACKTIKEKL